jgi:UDPglucose 6-dehydrogenase
MDNMRAVIPNMSYEASAMAALEGADACVLVTEWSEFLSLDWTLAKQRMARLS